MMQFFLIDHFFIRLLKIVILLSERFALKQNSLKDLLMLKSLTNEYAVHFKYLFDESLYVTLYFQLISAKYFLQYRFKPIREL